MKEWTDEDKAACEAAYKAFMLKDWAVEDKENQKKRLGERRAYLQKRERFSLKIDNEILADMRTLQSEIDDLNNELAGWGGGKSDEQQSTSTKLTDVKKRQVELIKAVREIMQEQCDNGDKVNRMQALRNIKNSGELRRLGYSGNNVLQKCRKLTDPAPVEKLGLPSLPR